MAIKFGMTVADMILQLTRGFMKATGRKPDGLEKIKIKQEANQRFKDQQKVVDMEGRTLDPSKPITGGTQEGAKSITLQDRKIKKAYDKAVSEGQFKGSEDDFRDKIDMMVDDIDSDFAIGGRVGFFKGAQADTKKGESMSPGTDTKGNIRDDNPFTGGGGDKPIDDDEPFIKRPQIDTKNIIENPYSNLNTPMGVAALSPAILARIARMGKKIKPIFGGDVGLEYVDEAGDATTNFKITQDIKDLIKEGELTPELKYKKEIGDDTFIEGGINKKGDANIFFKKKFDNLSDIFRFGKADGGRIGLKKGMDRRTFMKIMGGLTTLPVLGKFFKGAEVAAPVAKKAAEVASGAPTYFFDLANKIKIFGKQRQTPSYKERVNEYNYTGKDGIEYELIEDLDTGEIMIKKDKMGVASSGDQSYDVIEDRTEMVFKKGQADETTKGTPVDEYEEYKVEFDADGTAADATNIDEISKSEIIKEVTEEAPSIKKASGGIARMLGE